MSRALLLTNNYGVAFGERIILSRVNMEIAESGPSILMGPAGTGKSTLLRSLAGFNDASASFRSWGEVYYRGRPLSDSERPVLVSQNAKLLMSSVLENLVCELPERHNLTIMQQRDLAARLLSQASLDELQARLDENVIHLPLNLQRHIAIIRSSASNPPLLCIDEPTSGLEDEERRRLIEHIKLEATKRAILVVLHNQREARNLDGAIHLLAGGIIQESGQCSEFFSAPQSPAGIDFVRSGSCCVPSPSSKPEELDLANHTAPAPPPEEAIRAVSSAFGPRGFLWLKRGRLAGTPRPGIVHDIHYDLKALQRVGVTTLISLTTKPVETDLLKQYQIQGISLPIRDMQAPDTRSAAQLCQQVEALINAGECIAYHCKAGLGRTGTMLCAQLIWEGKSALEALEVVRNIEPRWVQSQEQIEFLSEFETALSDRTKQVI